MMLFGPGVKNITTAKTTKAIRSGCDISVLMNWVVQPISGNICFDGSCDRGDSSMMAMPQTTITIPDSRSGPKRSPNTMLEAAEPTKGTSSANGTTCAAV